jgi:hypothetical protein
MNQLTALLRGVRVGQPQTHHNLTIYPLHIQNGHQRSYKTLDEALTAQEVVVKEVSEGGSVPSLAVQNTGALPVLIIIGEALIGAKQNRVLNTSLLVPAKTELKIPVSCVEQGRWAYTSQHFSSSPSMSHSYMRSVQTDNVTKNLRAKSEYDADQGAVWQEVSRKMRSHSTSSRTAALHDVYDQTDNQLKEYLDAFSAPEAEGILAAINGQVVGADLFDHHDTLKTLFPKLARSYALDALERKEAASGGATGDDTRQFFSAVGEAKDELYDSVGLGKDVRLSGEQVTGSGLLWDDRVVHASLFNRKR